MTWKVLNLRQLDEGGFADVYIGVRSDTGEQVVVKYLRDCDNADARRLFAREMRILQKRLHGGLVECLGGAPDARRPFYAMPYYPGGKLTRWAGQLKHDQLRAAAHRICAAMIALHRHQISHGDLKPDNVLLTSKGDLRVGDPMGNGAGCTVAWAVNRGGTPGYWAPELAAGSPISPRTDVFSYGATLYHLATGRRPQDGQNLDPWTTGALVPREIRDVILACTVRDAAQRPYLAEVRRMLGGENLAAIRAEARRDGAAREDGMFAFGLLASGLLLAAACIGGRD